MTQAIGVGDEKVIPIRQSADASSPPLHVPRPTVARLNARSRTVRARHCPMQTGVKHPT